MNYKLLKSYMAEFVFLIYILFIYIFKLFNGSNYIDVFNIIFFIIFGIICFNLFGYAKCRKNTKRMVLQTIIIWILVYYFLIYMSGIVLGFLISPYALTLSGILTNMLPVIILIVLQESVRYMFIRIKGDNYKNVIIFTILFIILDLIVGYHVYNLATLEGVLKFLGLLFLPTISKHFLLSYLSYKAGITSAILYRIILDALVFILPIVPNLSVYLETVIKFSFPILLFLSLDRGLEKYEKNKSTKKVKNKKFIYVPITCCLIILISLVSGLFKYHMIAIGSGSMKPNINVGDAVIIEKLEKEEFALLDEGDVLAFRYDGRVVVHRIEEIKLLQDTYEFVTKGDANKELDDYTVTEDMVVGRVDVRIPYIGLPSVWLNDLFN